VLMSGPYDVELEGMARRQLGIPTPDPRNEAYFGTDASVWPHASIVSNIDAPPMPLLISWAERDLLQMQVQAGQLFAELVKHHGFRPELMLVRDHNHFSQTESVNTGDDSIGAPLLDFIARHAAPR
jgi:acetyl esterase